VIVLNYILYYGLIVPVSRLPFSMLYVLSDGLFYLMFYGVGYRRKVVFQNLKNSFPEKSEQELKKIARKFYRHFCDLFLESLKVFTISEKQVRARMKIRNFELLEKYFKQNKSVIIAGGHYNNWELFAVAIAASIQHQAIGIYRPLKNPFFNARMQETRSKYGLRMIPTKTVKKVFEEEQNNLTATIFGIDQSPPVADRCHWMKFLNQDTGVLFGTEKYAKEYNYPVVFGHITKEKRGYYSFSFFEACEDPSREPHGQITERVTKMLEKEIVQIPEYWLWSHKRWKQKKPVEVLA